MQWYPGETLCITCGERFTPDGEYIGYYCSQCRGSET